MSALASLGEELMAPVHLHDHTCIHSSLKPAEPRRMTEQIYSAGSVPPEKRSATDGGAGEGGAGEDGMAALRIVINADALRSDPGGSCFAAGDFAQGQWCTEAQVLCAARPRPAGGAARHPHARAREAAPSAPTEASAASAGTDSRQGIAP